MKFLFAHVKTGIINDECFSKYDEGEVIRVS